MGVARIGLVNMAVPADKLEEEAWNVGKTLTEPPPDALAVQKEAFNTHLEIMGLGVAVHGLHVEGAIAGLRMELDNRVPRVYCC